MIFNYTFTYFLITVICALISIIILLQLNINMGSEQEVKTFRYFIISYLVFVLSNAVWVWINYGYLNIPGGPFSMINLIAICVDSYFWFKYIELKISAEFVKKKIFTIISLIPLMVAILLIVTTRATKWVFYYNENNQYIHGPFYSTMFILAVSYLIVATIHILLTLKNVHTKAKRKEYLILATFLLFPVIAGVLDITAENLPIMELSLLFGLILIYTNMQQSQIYNDSLTNLNNRRAADNYLLNTIPLVSQEKPLYFFMADIDKFKMINDTRGHIVGDQALIIVGQALKEYGDSHRCFIARWGGDEFCIIFHQQLNNPQSVIDEIQNIIDYHIKTNQLDYEIKLSIGFVKCISHYADIEKVIDAADKKLYEQKNSA